MVDWRPLMGMIPPTNENEWLEVFERYQQFPEYQQLNNSMTLSQFKSIFFWEYLHRLFGRLLGIVFLIPWVYFNIRKRFALKFNFKLLILFALGGAQGVLGWYMVSSGLIEIPRVSHYRLAAHLALAMALLGATLWQILNLRRGIVRRELSSHRHLVRMGIVFTALISLQKRSSQ